MYDLPLHYPYLMGGPTLDPGQDQRMWRPQAAQSYPSPGLAACASPPPSRTDPSKGCRHNKSHTTPRAPPTVDQPHQAGNSPLAAAPAAAGSNGASVSGLPPSTPLYLHLHPVKGSTSPPAGHTGLTPLAAQLQLGGTAGAAGQPQQAPHYTLRVEQAAATYFQEARPGPGGQPGQQPQQQQQQQQQQAFCHEYQALACQVGPKAGGPSPTKPSAHHTRSAPQGDAIKALRQTDPAQAAAHHHHLPRHDPSWPIIPGLPVVEGPQTGVPHHPPLHMQAPLGAQGAPPPYHPPTQQHMHQPAPVPVTAAYSPHVATSATPPQLPPQLPLPAKRRGMSSVAALRTLGHMLTSHERGEVLHYKQIWFAGRAGTAKIAGGPFNCDPNNGYDDERGDYLAVRGDHVAYRYEVQGVLGRGSFGQVLRCVDHATGATVALKIIRNKKRFQRQAAVEAGILTTIAQRDPGGAAGAVRMLESFTFRCHLCITFELLHANLYEHLKAGQFAGCSQEMVGRVARQVLRTLCFLRELDIVHADLKPENILLTSRGASTVKVIDFGSSCFSDQRVFTYIQSRFYRAPEVILGKPYGPPIDIFSLGCVLAELLTGAPLFPGEDEVEQLACLMEVLGVPPRRVTAGAVRLRMFFDIATGTPLPVGPNSRGVVHHPGTKTLEAALGPKAEPLFLDFLKGCLCWDPAQRWTPQQALQHEWLRQGAPGGEVQRG